MDLLTWTQDPDRRNRLLIGLKISPGYLRQIAIGWGGRKPSPRLTLRIEALTKGRVSRHELRPDVYGKAPVSQRA